MLLVGLALSGCGGSGAATGRSDPASALRAAVLRFRSDVAKRDAIAACADITPGFWTAMKGQLDGALLQGGGSVIPGQSCVSSLRYVFTSLPSVTGDSPHASFRVEKVSVHGMRAWATLVAGGAPQREGFLRASGGRWQLACCTGRQLDQQPVIYYRVPSISMQPTLRLDQLIRVNNSALRGRVPAIGEIVSFHPPAAMGCSDHSQGVGRARPCGTPPSASTDSIQIKRVVGLPGDRIAIVNGRAIRDGKSPAEPYATRCEAPECNLPSAIVVPPGTYFLLGDNRGDSFDSRFFGPVPRAWIVGLVRP
jgi:signal peptidase I